MDETTLANVLYEYADQRMSRRIAQRMKEARFFNKLQTTTDLEQLVFSCYPSKLRSRARHPATLTFQALRIAVNDEFRCLERMLKTLPSLMSDGARCAVISFHSHEHRAVRHAFKRMKRNGLKLLTPRGERPKWAEVEQNPRARSAKLHVCEKLPASGAAV